MKKHDSIVVLEKKGRRHFIRAGAAFLLAGASAGNAQEEGGFGADCDQRGWEGEKNAEAANTDGDSGIAADRPGCGRKKPTLTEYQDKGHKKVKVAKVIV